jgi:hypothetical protein
MRLDRGLVQPRQGTSSFDLGMQVRHGLGAVKQGAPRLLALSAPITSHRLPCRQPSFGLVPPKRMRGRGSTRQGASPAAVQPILEGMLALTVASSRTPLNPWMLLASLLCPTLGITLSRSPHVAIVSISDHKFCVNKDGCK